MIIELLLFIHSFINKEEKIDRFSFFIRSIVLTIFTLTVYVILKNADVNMIIRIFFTLPVFLFTMNRLIFKRLMSIGLNTNWSILFLIALFFPVIREISLIYLFFQEPKDWF